jgi:uncharacterized protein YndB with AHSA1/START domain
MTPEFIEEIKTHLNADHRKDLRDITKVHAGLVWALDASLETIDLRGMQLHVVGTETTQTVFVAWQNPAEHSGQLEARFMALLTQAKTALGQPLELVQTDLYGTGRHSLTFAHEQVFAALTNPDHYPQWLPMVGVVVASSHNPLRLGSSLRFQPRGQPDVTIQMQVEHLKNDHSFALHENSAHQHKLEFQVTPVAQGCQLEIRMGSHASVEVSEIEEHNRKFGKLAEIIARKLQGFLEKSGGLA